MSTKKNTNNICMRWQYVGSKSTRLLIAIFIIVITLIFCSCTAGPGSKYTPDNKAGFLVGFWHGFIWIVTLIISFFSENISVYETNNTGLSYNIGFVLGIVASIFLVVSKVIEKFQGYPMDPNTKASLLKRESAELAAKNEYHAAIKKDLKALRIFEKTGYDRARVATHIALGRMYLAVGDLINAQDHLQTSYRDSQRTGYEQFLLESAELLGEFLLRNGQPGEALSYFEKSLDIEEKETTGIKAGTTSVPMPGVPSKLREMFPDQTRAIIGRLPLEIALRHLHCLLSKANVARALLASGKSDKAISTLDHIISSLKDFPNQIDPEKNVEIKSAWIYAVMSLGKISADKMEEAISSLKNSIQELISRAEHDLGESKGSIKVLQQTAQMFLGFRQQVAVEIRKWNFPS